MKWPSRKSCMSRKIVFFFVFRDQQNRKQRSWAFKHKFSMLATTIQDSEMNWATNLRTPDLKTVLQLPWSAHLLAIRRVYHLELLTASENWTLSTSKTFRSILSALMVIPCRQHECPLPLTECKETKYPPRTCCAHAQHLPSYLKSRTVFVTHPSSVQRKVHETAQNADLQVINQHHMSQMAVPRRTPHDCEP